MAIYPGHIAAPYGLNTNVPVSRKRPRAFLVLVEDGGNAENADVATEIHLHAHGEHAFGLCGQRPSQSCSGQRCSRLSLRRPHNHDMSISSNNGFHCDVPRVTRPARERER